MNIQIKSPYINPYRFTFKKSDNQISPNKLEKSPKDDKFEFSIGYMNDLHGQTNNMMRILSGMKGDLRLSGGDNDIGDEKNKAVHKAVIKFMNLAGIRATALGNHEMDTKQNDFIDTLKEFNGDVLAVNLKQEPLETQDKDEIEEFERGELNEAIKKSIVVEVKGEKIGIVGAAPIDFAERITHPSYHKDCTIENLEDTIEHIQDEIEKLREQGINKVILVSHLGNSADKTVASNTDGLDVIIGGHTHELVKDIKEGENLIYSKTGEPVIITEAGKNGKHFGKLNLIFDKDGVIVKAQNNLANTENFSKNLVHQYIFNQLLGEPEVLGQIKEVVPPPQTLVEENAHANFACDAMRHELGVEIAIWNNSGTRAYFREGVIDSRDVKDIAPFEDRVSVADVSEKKLVDMFKHAIEDTYSNPGQKPGLLAVSGLTYVVDAKEGKLAGMSFVDNNGNEFPIDIENPREDKLYKVAEDSFMMFEGADLDVLAPKEECINYPFNKDYLICEYIKHSTEPVVINQTGRISFI